MSLPPTDFGFAARPQTLRDRAVLARAVRQFFDAAGYLEVETPVLSADVVVDAHLEPLVTTVHTDPGAKHTAGRRRFLQTSPEFHMKRLLAAHPDLGGGTPGAIWQMSRVFRDGEAGTRHNPEFTMAEWYRVGDGWREQAAFTDRLVRAAWSAAPPNVRPALPAAAFAVLTYDEAFARFAGTPVLTRSAAELRDLAADRGVSLPGGSTGESDEGDDPADRDDLLTLLLSELVEPHLGTAAGTGGPCFLCDYPATQAALARVRPGDPPVAERFELYADGLELANGYHELTDPAELRRRIGEENRRRVRGGLRELPAESRLLAAMEAGLPPCAGVALGFDRLAMWLLGKGTLAEVTAFPNAVA